MLILRVYFTVAGLVTLDYLPAWDATFCLQK